MSSNLGSMVLQLSANTAQFQSDMGKAAYIAQQNAEKMHKAISGAVDGIGNKLGEIAGKLVAAFGVEKLIEFGAQAIETADQFGKMAQKVGVSVESLSALAVQAKLSNVGIDQLQGGMEKLAKNAAAAAEGNKQSAAGFTAIGVSVKDTIGNLRPMQDIMGDVAKKFASYSDSAGKTALAQQLFGKSGAELIPILNDLGDKGFAGVTKQAQEFGAVISGDTAKRAEEFEDNLSRLKIEATGFATAVAAQLLPALNKLTGNMVDAGKTTDNYATSAGTVATAIKVVVAAFIAIGEMVKVGVTQFAAFFDAVRIVFDSAGQLVSAWATDTGKAIKSAFTLDKAGLDAAKADLDNRIAAISTSFNKGMAGVKAGLGGGLEDALKTAKGSWDALFGTFSNVTEGSSHVSKGLRDSVAPLVANADAAKLAEDANKKLGDMFAKDAQILASLAGKIDPVQAKYQEYVKNIEAANKAYTDEIALAAKAGAGTIALAQAKQILIDKSKASAAALQAELAAMVKQNDVVGLYLTKISSETAMAGLTDRQQEQQKAVDDLTASWVKLTEAERQQQIQAGHTDPTTAAGTALIRNQTGALYDQKKAADLAKEAAKGWQSIWSSAANSVADTFAKVIVEGGNLFDSLKNIAKQTVEQIIAYFLKLAVINPILNSIFGGMAGGGFSLLPTLANAAMGSGGGGGGAFSGSIAGVMGGGGSGGGATSMFSPSSWVSAGQNLYSGFTSMFSGSVSSTGAIPGGGSYTLQNVGSAGNAATAGSYGGYSSGMGQAAGIAGGLYAGYNEYKSSGGSLAGAATYAVGTYFAGAAVSTALAGGLAAGLAAIPVVGWIAIAAMLIDKFSGGKLFGTAWSTKAATTSLNIGPEGGDATAFLSQTKQGSLFSGTKYRDKTVAAGADAQAAAQSLFDAVQKTMVTAAHQLAIDVPPVIQAALDVVNTFDKKGKVTSTKYVVEILGKKYEEASQELAATRIAAEAIVATVAASEAGKAASTIAEQWRSSAETLMDGAQFLLAATVDLSKGKDLLGPGGTLTDITDVITGLQQGNEKLLDTYARVVAENDLMTQALALTGVNIGKTGAEFVKFADGVAQAAGGIDALNQLVQTFNQAYFSAADIQAQSLKTLKSASDTALTDIGEDPLESMQKFKQDFLAALPTLTPEELAKWYAAGVALANYTKNVTDSANQLSAGKQNYAAFEMKLFGYDFVSSFAAIVQAEQQQIDQANALAKAAGLAGASQQDLAAIMTQGSFQMGKALADLTNGIQADITSIYGAKQIMTSFGPDVINIPGIQASKDAADKQQQNQNISSAYDLIQKLGEFAFASGQSMDDVLKQFGITPEQIAKTLGITPDQFAADFKLATDQAASLTTMAAQGAEQSGILKDILAAIQGKPLPYDLSALAAPNVVAAAPGEKPGGRNIAPAPRSGGLNVTAPETPGTRQVVDATKDTGTRIVQAVENLHAFLRGGPGQTILRNQRFATPVRVA